MNITIKEAQKLTSPNPFALVSTVTPEGETNLMALSWWTFLSNNPGTLGVCLSKKGYSGSLIRESGEFAVNIVGEGLEKSAFLCGTCSGRDRKKAEEFGIELEDSATIKPKKVKNSKIVFECEFKDSIEVTDHIFYIGEIKNIEADPEVKALYAVEGYSKLSVIK